MSNFCAQHAESSKDKSNKEILDDLAKSVRECIFVTQDKKIGARRYRNAWAKFTNSFNELVNRGYRKDDIMRSITALHNAKGTMDDIFAVVGDDQKWRKFEKLVSSIHKVHSQDAKVTFNDSIRGKRTGRNRQIDISVRFDYLYYSYLIVIECKDYNTRVPISDVEAFRTKMEDVGADKGVIVSTNGFQCGAVETGKAFGIELFTLTEERTDWTQLVKEFRIAFPCPRHITFDNCETTHTNGKFIPQQVSMKSIVLYANGGEIPLALTDIIKNTCIRAHHGKWALPTEVYVQFEHPYLMQLPASKDRIKVRGLTLFLDEYRYRKRQEIDIPPEIVS